MPNTRNKKNTITHPLYRNAFLLRRGDVIYTSIVHEGNRYRETTQLSWNTKNFALAERILEKRWLALFNPDIKPEAYNLRELFDTYLNFKSKSIKAESLLKYEHAWKSFITREYMTDDIDIIKQDLNAAISKTHLSNNTAVKSLQLLSAFFEHILENQYISSNPITSSMLPKTTKKKPLAYTFNEIQSILQYFTNNHEMYHLVKLISLTGMRLNEARTLKRENIFDNHIVVNGKGGVDRIIPVLAESELYELLKELKNKTSPFNWSSNTRPHRNFLKAIQSLKIERLSGFHGIRKYYENMLIQSGLNIKVVAQIIGHTTQVQSKNYITELEISDLTEAMSKVSK